MSNGPEQHSIQRLSDRLSAAEQEVLLLKNAKFKLYTILICSVAAISLVAGATWLSIPDRARSAANDVASAVAKETAETQAKLVAMETANDVSEKTASHIAENIAGVIAEKKARDYFKDDKGQSLLEVAKSELDQIKESKEQAHIAKSEIQKSIDNMKGTTPTFTNVKIGEKDLMTELAQIERSIETTTSSIAEIGTGLGGTWCHAIANWNQNSTGGDVNTTEQFKVGTTKDLVIPGIVSNRRIIAAFWFPAERNETFTNNLKFMTVIPSPSNGHCVQITSEAGETKDTISAKIAVIAIHAPVP